MMTAQYQRVKNSRWRHIRKGFEGTHCLHAYLTHVTRAGMDDEGAHDKGARGAHGEGKVRNISVAASPTPIMELSIQVW